MHAETMCLQHITQITSDWKREDAFMISRCVTPSASIIKYARHALELSLKRIQAKRFTTHDWYKRQTRCAGACTTPGACTCLPITALCIGIAG